jgi:hypothetical protein
MGIKQEQAKVAAVAAFEKAQKSLAEFNAKAADKYGQCEPLSVYKQRRRLMEARDNRLMSARRWGALHHLPFLLP